MPSTEDATLQLIQREISEVMQREKELKDYHSRSNSRNTTSSSESESRNSPEPILQRAQSTSSLFNGHNSGPVANGGRLFTQNPTKGIMQRFIKSRGRISTVAAISSKKMPTPTTWTNQEFVEPLKAIVPAGMQPRNGFVPVEERIRREFNEMKERETELKIERQKSQPNLLALLESSSPEPERKTLQSMRSMSQLSDDTYYCDNQSGSLKTARSLADLCNVDDEEEQPPGSLTLIKQWETLIQKNQPNL